MNYYDNFDYADEFDGEHKKHKGGRTMKKFIYALVAVLLCGIIVGGAVYVANAEKQTGSQGTIIQDSGDGKG